jgi:hypothetical protein
VLMLVVSILHLHYLAATQMDALKISLESSLGSRRSFSSQLPVEELCMFLFRCWLLERLLVETFGHVINV